MLRNANRNEILGYVRECEQAHIIRVGNELLVTNDITETPDAGPKSLSRKYTKVKAKEHEQQYIKKKKCTDVITESCNITIIYRYICKPTKILYKTNYIAVRRLPRSNSRPGNTSNILGS